MNENAESEYELTLKSESQRNRRRYLKSVGPSSGRKKRQGNSHSHKEKQREIYCQRYLDLAMEEIYQHLKAPESESKEGTSQDLEERDMQCRRNCIDVDWLENHQ